jgi:hypothetical protein
LRKLVVNLQAQSADACIFQYNCIDYEVPKVAHKSKKPPSVCCITIQSADYNLLITICWLQSADYNLLITNC